MKILITGATGFVGGMLAAHLRAEGYEVLAHSRAPSQGCVACAFENEAGLRTLMEGADILIHAAGRKSGIRTADFMIDNRDLPVRLYDLAAQTEVKQFIFLSSSTALLNLLPNPQLNLPETTPANIHVNWAYAASKAQAEHALLSRANLPGQWPLLCIVRPGLIWGRNAPFHQRLQKGQIKLWGKVDQMHSTVHIDNLADMIAHLLAYKGAQRIFHPQDPAPANFPTFCSRLAAHLDAPLPARISPALVGAGATLAKLLIGLTFGRVDPGLQGIHMLFGRSFTTDDQATRAALKWEPQKP